MMREILKNIIDGCIKYEARFIKPKPHSKKRVIILRKDTLGDYILFYPTLSAYKDAFTDADITLVISKLFRSLSPLLRGFDHIIWFDAKRYSVDFFYRRNFLLALRRGGYDIAIGPTFSCELAGDLMMKMTKATVIIGVLGGTTDKNAYTKLISVPETVISEIERDRYIAQEITGRKVDIEFPTMDASIFPDDQAMNIVRQNRLIPRRYIIIAPGSGTAFKIWPLKKFAQIADHLADIGLTPVFCGSKEEKVLVHDIMEKMTNKERAVDISGQTDLPTMMHILKLSLMCFGNDTGIIHLAAAIKTPTICIMGGGHFRRFFPYGDLEKNRIVFDPDMTCRGDDWMCAKGLPKDEPAPCIKNITFENARKEIHALLSIIR